MKQDDLLKTPKGNATVIETKMDKVKVTMCDSNWIPTHKTDWFEQSECEVVVKLSETERTTINGY